MNLLGGDSCGRRCQNLRMASAKLNQPSKGLPCAEESNTVSAKLDPLKFVTSTNEAWRQERQCILLPGRPHLFVDSSPVIMHCASLDEIHDDEATFSTDYIRRFVNEAMSIWKEHPCHRQGIIRSRCFQGLTSEPSLMAKQSFEIR